MKLKAYKLGGGKWNLEARGTRRSLKKVAVSVDVATADVPAEIVKLVDEVMPQRPQPGVPT